MNASTIALINIILQPLLIVVLVYAIYLARRKQLKKHCTVLRITGGVLLIDILAGMLPAMLGFLKPGLPLNKYTIEIIAHHSLGLLVVLIWIFVNLVLLGVIHFGHRLRIYMWIATAAWVISFLLGIHLYLVMWTGLLA